MASSSSNVENLSPEVLKMVSKELIKLTKEPLDGIKVFINEEDISDIQASIEGPGGTPYEKGNFKMKLVLGKDFPASPPQGFFLTKIFHPNVASNGAICVNTLKRDWKPDHGIRHILLTIKCLLIYPNPNSALNEEAGKLLQEEYDTYFERAKMITAIHAKSTQKQDEAMQAEVTAKRKCMDVESHIGKKKKDKKGLKRL